MLLLLLWPASQCLRIPESVLNKYMQDEKHAEILHKLSNELNSPTCTAALKAIAPTPPAEGLECPASNRTHCSPEWEGEAPSIGGSLVCPSIPIAEFDSAHTTLGS